MLSKIPVASSRAVAVAFISRRQMLGALLGGATFFGGAPSAEAAIARGLSLDELVRASVRVVLGVPLAAECRRADFGGRSMIVTDTRVRIDELIAKEPPASEIIVRTLGGTLGNDGERVEGQPRLLLGAPGVLFLVSASDIEFVTGMAQGHYPLRADARGVQHLTPSRHLPRLLDPRRSAVAALSGKELATARTLIREALAR